MSKKTESIEIDLSLFSREQLEHLIQLSCEQDVSINQVIGQLLENLLDEQQG